MVDKIYTRRCKIGVMVKSWILCKIIEEKFHFLWNIELPKQLHIENIIFIGFVINKPSLKWINSTIEHIVNEK